MTDAFPGGPSSPGPLSALLAAARATDRNMLVLDLGGVTDKAGFMERCARDLALPTWFGRNWDALADCLTELPPGTLLVVTDWRAYAAQRPGDWEIAQDVFESAVDPKAERTVLLALG